MRFLINPPNDCKLLTPCAARLVEILCQKSDYFKKNALLKRKPNKTGSLNELDLKICSPSQKVGLHIVTNRHGVQVNCFEWNKYGKVNEFFTMHPLNFHRTCEAVSEFVVQIMNNEIVLAREQRRVLRWIPLGPKTVCLLERKDPLLQTPTDIQYHCLWSDEKGHSS